MHLDMSLQLLSSIVHESISSDQYSPYTNHDFQHVSKSTMHFQVIDLDVDDLFRLNIDWPPLSLFIAGSLAPYQLYSLRQSCKGSLTIYLM